jgi:hypothetical protein
MKFEKVDVKKFENYLRDFVFIEGDMQKKTVVKEREIGDIKVRYYVNEFWTSRQRQGSSIHRYHTEPVLNLSCLLFLLTL